MNYRYVIAGLLCLSMALALDISSPNQLLTAEQGEVADFTVVFAGEGNVQLTVDSEVPAVLSKSKFVLDGIEEIHIFALTDEMPIGDYIVTLNALPRPKGRGIKIIMTDRNVRPAFRLVALSL